MALRIATSADIDELMGMAYKFAQASNYFKYVDPVKVSGFILGMVQPNPNTVIFLHEGQGMLAAAVTPFIFGTPLLATEVAWWVEPEARLKGVGKELVDAYEVWARDKGCTMISMTCLDDSVAKWYEAQDYKLYERVYFKELA